MNLVLRALISFRLQNCIIKAVFHYAEFCARSDLFRVTGKVELLSTLLPHNFGGKCRSARKIPLSGKQA